MPEPEFNEQQIGGLLRELWEERAPFNQKLRVRRMLLELADGGSTENAVGTYLPAPYDESTLILRAQVGDAMSTLNNYVSRIAANEPQTQVVPVSLSSGSIGQRVDERAGDEERLLMAMWEGVRGRTAQYKVTRSQAWGRAGWYLTLPRDASWGLPDREYFEDLTDDEIDSMRRTGKATPVFRDGEKKFAEPYESWMERRRTTAQEQAVSGRSLFSLEALPPDMVFPRYDRDGTAEPAVKYGFVLEEIPSSWFAPGSELAMSAAELAGYEGDISQYQLYANEDGKIAGGVTRGGEPDSQNGLQSWTLARFLTRDEVYYYVTDMPGSGSGKIVYYDRHGAGKVPLIPVPGLHGDSGRPGSEYTSVMEDVFATIPLINQIETLLSNVATWNALGRFYVITPDGTELEDEAGNPLIIQAQETVPGLDPGSVSTTRGELKQITLEASMLLQLLEFYTQRMDVAKPSAVTEGVSGTSAAAWQVRQLLAASGELVRQSVDNHAEAVKQVQLLWVRWMRMLDEPIYAFAVPGHRKNERSVRGLIEFKPEDLVESIRVSQAPQSAQERVVQRQVGIELLQAGRIDEHQFYEEYDLSDDPEESIVRAWAQRAVDLVMLGNTDQVDPDALLAHIVKAARGRATMALIDRFPNFALAQSREMAMSTAAMAAQGNVAASAGVVEPGLGMATQQGGSPMQGAPEGLV